MRRERGLTADRKKGLLATVGGVLVTIVFAASALCFGARQVVTSAAPGLLDTLGLGWLALEAPSPATLDTQTHDCELFWLRNGLTTLSYTLTCTAEREPIAITEFRLTAIDAADWHSGAWQRDPTQVYTYEEQWPMSGQTVRIEPDRTWSYEGNMAAGAADWFGGAPRALVWSADVSHPDRDAEHQSQLCESSDTACRIHLASVERPR